MATTRKYESKDALDRIPVVLSTAGSSGDIVVVGPSGEEFPVILLTDGANGATVWALRRGVFPVTKATSEDWALGEKVYYDTSDADFTSVATANVYAGRAWGAQSTTSAAGDISLNEA